MATAARSSKRARLEAQVPEAEADEEVDFEHLCGRIVKVFTTSCKPNYSMPWQMRRQGKSTSTGFVISGKRIITNAHCVAHATAVQIRRQGTARKIAATIVHCGHECDLAILTVDDDEFWAAVEASPLPLGGLPELQDQVCVVGFPTGGDNICITAGVVSRLDMQVYSHSGQNLLAIQIDAAINGGNSGGPALHHGSVIGE